ncbi:glycosyltransferase [Undibacterium sp. Ji50W]|uniref:glycosyltransferase n=1 Tax=Undibacterium sp. Ji50W TaxID=3413041 RepID=UPI003BF0E1AC
MSYRPVKVLHSCPVWLAPTQTWLYNQIKSLPADIACTVACIGLSKPELFPVDDLHSFCGTSGLRYKFEALLRKLNIPLYPFWLRQYAKRSRSSVIHSHFGNMGWFDRHAAMQLNLPHVVTFYGLDVDHLPQQDARWITRYAQLFDSVDLVLCEGSHMASRIVARGCKPEKVRVHHLGVDLQFIPFQARSWSPSTTLKVMIAGAFREKKGIPCALEVLGRLQDNVDLEITLIGDADADPRSKEEKQKILAVIDKYGMADKVRMLGYCTHAKMLEEAYKNHIFFSPSVHAKDGDSEGGLPVSIIEMAASGMPVVSTFHCDIPEVIKHGVSGLLAQEHDVDGLLAQLQSLILAPEKWLDYSRAARALIEAEYDVSLQADKLAAIYRELRATREV